MHVPKYRLHKATGLGYVELNGHRYYLGKYQTPESEERYRRMLQEYLAVGRAVVARTGATVSMVAAAYLAHAEEWYRKPDGTPTKQITVVRPAIRALRSLYGSVPAEEFRPSCLRVLVSQWADARLSVETVNKYRGQVLLAFKHGVAHDMVPAPVWQALLAVDRLIPGRTRARVPQDIQPVSWGSVEAVRPHVSPEVWGMIRIQWLTGARSGEVTTLRSTDIDTRGAVWQAVIKDHKTAYRGKRRVLRFGIEAQGVLREFLADCPVGGYLFSPARAIKRRAEDAGGHRRERQRQDPRKTGRRVGDHYTPDSYRRAIQRACDAADVPHWHPHQLRHTFGTMVRQRYGQDAAQVALGHAWAKTTEVYAQPNEALAIKVAEEMG